MNKIYIEIEDMFYNCVSGSPSYFKKCSCLRQLKVIDDYMSHQQPGKYKITISIEQIDAEGYHD